MTGRDIWISVGSGILLGTFCAFANYSVITSSLGQMVTPWVLTGVIVGGLIVSRRGAVSGGLVALPLGVATYYVIAAVDRDLVTQKYFLIWTGLALVVGPLSGLAGWSALHGSVGWRTAATASITAVLIAEVAVLWFHIRRVDASVTYGATLLAAVTIPFIELRDLPARSRIRSLLFGVVLAIPGALLFELAFGRLGLITPS